MKVNHIYLKIIKQFTKTNNSSILYLKLNEWLENINVNYDF